jgi:hypothetical protein
MTRGATTVVVAFGLVLGSVLAAMFFQWSPVLGQATLSQAEKVLEDFTKPDSDGFPQGWQASRSEAATRQAYVIQREGDQVFLRTKGVHEQTRIKKRIAWDPKEFPIVTWLWRLRGAPQGTSMIAAVFVSLDTDLLVIPVATKYLWASSGSVGTMKEGGLFGAAEILVRSGPQPVGQWIEERVNAYADFLKLHKHEPSPQAWGISLLTGPGVELDFGPIGLAHK